MAPSLKRGLDILSWEDAIVPQSRGCCWVSELAPKTAQIRIFPAEGTARWEPPGQDASGREIIWTKGLRGFLRFCIRPSWNDGKDRQGRNGIWKELGEVLVLAQREGR